ncbi:MAG: helix-turn-helix domain-containing protein [Flavobacteriales bacterium]|nr:helix-turn-helix domain-containing protein [Flavobacteriales bacterium]
MSEGNIEWKFLTDQEVLEKLGAEVRRMRLERNLAQSVVAERAGVDRTTVVKIEAGKASNMLNLIQVLRAIGRLDVLDNFHEEPRLTPMMALEQEAKYYRKQRKRASPPKATIVPPKPKPKSTW